MRAPRIHFLFVGVIGLLLVVTPTQLLAHTGGALKRIAEQLGLNVRGISEPKVGDRLILRVVNPEKLAAYGIRDLQANSEVEVTILSEEQVSVAPATLADPKERVAADAPRLVVALGDEGAIEQTHIIRADVNEPIAMPAEGRQAPPR